MLDFKEGAFLSPEDKRDWRLSSQMDLPCTSELKKMLPQNYRVSWLPQVKNQGKVGSCTAFAMSLIYSCMLHRSHWTQDDFSIVYIYGNRKDTLYRGEGAYMRDVVKAITRHGDVFYEALPGNIEMIEAMNIFNEKYEELNPQAIKLVSGYVRLYTEEEAKSWMIKYPDVPLFTAVDVNDIYGKIVTDGSHALPLIGWDGHKAIFQNSWGKNYQYPEIEFSKIQEMWGIIPMENEKVFKDVSIDRWSASAINEASKDGIIEGFPDGTFAPDKPLTREQVAVIWQRMKKYFENN